MTEYHPLYTAIKDGRLLDAQAIIEHGKQQGIKYASGTEYHDTILGRMSEQSYTVGVYHSYIDELCREVNRLLKQLDAQGECLHLSMANKGGFWECQEPGCNYRKIEDELA